MTEAAAIPPRPGAAAPAAGPRIAQALTPMMRQYLEAKARYPDALLFFRLGDFYELFFDDAVTASEALQITLTARAKGDDKVPMCGVPHHAARGYIAKLLERGHKVAICDQVEEPGKSALVRREVTRVVTPGMILDDQVLDPRQAAYVGAVTLAPGEEGGGIALLDASTGELRVGELASDERLVDELRRAGVRELLLARQAAATSRGAALVRAVGAPLAEREETRLRARGREAVPAPPRGRPRRLRAWATSLAGRRRPPPRWRTWRTRSAWRRCTSTGSRGCRATMRSCSTNPPGRTWSWSGPSPAVSGRGLSWRSSTVA